VRFTREISGTGELFVDGRGHREEIEIFPGKPLANKISLNVVDLCPVGALLDKDFLFKQRVWLLKKTPSISPVDAGGENIWLEWNEGKVYRVKPRINMEVNTWWISDDTRYSFHVLEDKNRLKTPMKKELGALTAAPFGEALAAATDGFKLALQKGGGSAVVLSPMMAIEEAYLLGKYIRSLDPNAALVLGPCPTVGQNDKFFNSLTGKQTFEIQAEKVPNRKGIERVMQQLGGRTMTWDQLSGGTAGALSAAWVVGGYLSTWVKDVPSALRGAFVVAQDTLPNEIVRNADVVLPSAFWAEKAGTWENYAGKLQPFDAAIAPPEGTRREGDVYFKLLGRTGFYNADAVRKEIGGDLAKIELPKDEASSPAFEFVEV
jgi:NADH-quinone oxidoreductase subunit G